MSYCLLVVKFAKDVFDTLIPLDCDIFDAALDISIPSEFISPFFLSAARKSPEPQPTSSRVVFCVKWLGEYLERHFMSRLMRGRNIFCKVEGFACFM